MSEAEVRKVCVGASNGELVESLVVLMAGFVRQQGELKNWAEAVRLRDDKIAELREELSKARQEHIADLKAEHKRLKRML